MSDTFFEATRRNNGLIEKVNRKVNNQFHGAQTVDDIIRVTVETTREHDRHFDRSEQAYKIASMILQPGDKIRTSRCGGNKINVTFAGWDKKWATSKSGIDDIGAADIDKVNGVTVNLSALWNQRIEVLYETFDHIKQRREAF